VGVGFRRDVLPFPAVFLLFRDDFRTRRLVARSYLYAFFLRPTKYAEYIRT